METIRRKRNGDGGFRNYEGQTKTLLRRENNYQLLYSLIGRSRSFGGEGMEVDPVRVTSTAPSYRGGSRDSPNSRFEEAAFYYCEKLFQGSS